MAGSPISLPPKATSFRDWAIALQDRARSGSFDDELPHWAATTATAISPLPTDGDATGIPATTADARTVTVSLTREETRALLQDVPGAYRTQVNDVLLAALGQTLASWTGHDQVLIDCEGHGRETGQITGTDLSRTIGWFTTIYPIALHLPPGDWGTTLKSVKEQLRAILGTLHAAPLTPIGLQDCIIDATARSLVAYAAPDGVSGGGGWSRSRATVN